MTSTTIQNMAVIPIVAIAALYVLWRVVPARWRRPLSRVHPALAQERPGCASGCGGCARSKASSSCQSTHN